MFPRKIEPRIVSTDVVLFMSVFVNLPLNIFLVQEMLLHMSEVC